MPALSAWLIGSVGIKPAILQRGLFSLGEKARLLICALHAEEHYQTSEVNISEIRVAMI